jgi:RimJ/RimL family protein N-acetyltransferase
LRLVYGRDAEVERWVVARAPHAENGFKDFAAIGVEHAGELVAGVVYNEFRGHSIHVSMASTTPRWAARGVLYGIFAYPFVQLKCERMTAYTGRSMTHVRQFLERLGFQQEGIVRRGFADDDCVIYGMLKDECKWIRFDEKRRQSSPAA